jgi:hypothetical protein
MAKPPRLRNSTRSLLLGAAVLSFAFLAAWASAAESVAGSPSPRWFKGNVHAHSVWSDGDAFPEMVADWYKSHGYQFLAISDHNILLRGRHATLMQRKPKPIPQIALDTYRKRFDDDWVQTQGEGAALAVRLAGRRCSDWAPTTRTTTTSSA